MENSFTDAIENAINSKQKENEKEGLVIMLIGLLLCVPLIMYRGWVIIQFWDWFVTPTFTSLPSLTLVPAIGLSALIYFLTMNPLATTVKHSTIMTIWIGFFTTSWFWLTGWIVSLFL